MDNVVYVDFNLKQKVKELDHAEIAWSLFLEKFLDLNTVIKQEGEFNGLFKSGD